MKIRTWITCLVGSATIAIAVLAVFGWQALRQTTRSLDEIVNQQLLVLINTEIGPLIDNDMLPLINQDVVHLQTLRKGVEQMLQADRDIRQAVIAEKEALVATEEAESQAASHASIENIQRAEELIDAAVAGSISEEGRVRYKELQQAFAVWKGRTRTVVETATDPDRLAFARKASYGGSAFKAFEDVRGAVSRVISAQQQEIDQALARIEARRARIDGQKAKTDQHEEAATRLAGIVQQRARFMTLLFPIVGVATAVAIIVLGYLLSRAILRSLTETVVLIKDIADGDLTRGVGTPRSDEIGMLANHFNDMVTGLKGILGQVQDVALQISAAGQEIRIISEAQAASAQDQSSAVSETTSAALQLSKTSEQIGENIKTISQMAGHVLSGMEKIKQATDQTNRILTSLNEKSKQIGSITELIDDVADQTNLLAVNASIEAARAGEQGRGFTVVADQIGKLADSTARSTKDITSLVEMIRHEMSNAILAMEQSLSGVEEEILLAKESASKSKEIAMSATQQISGSRQIAEAMASIDLAMKQMNSGAQQSSEAAGQLTMLADELKASMGRFKVTEHA